MSGGERIEAVGHHYDGAVYEFELDRLEKEFTVEHAITRRILERWLPPNPASVAEIGVGGGYYTEWLAARGYQLHLFDISERLLGYVEAKVGTDRLQSVRLRSATDLLGVADESFDAVLLLGPLYHLLTLEGRQTAVREAARVLKPNGVLFAAGINRMAYLHEQLRRESDPAPQRAAFILKFLQDGNLDPENAMPIGYAHLSGIDQFRALFDGIFEQLEFAGVESFAGHWQANFAALDPAAQEFWLRIIEQTSTSIEGLGRSEHMLFVGRKVL